MVSLWRKLLQRCQWLLQFHELHILPLFFVLLKVRACNSAGIILLFYHCFSNTQDSQGTIQVKVHQITPVLVTFNLGKSYYQYS